MAKSVVKKVQYVGLTHTITYKLKNRRTITMIVIKSIFLSKKNLKNEILLIFF
jgi:hypothetical protein